ATGEWYDLFDDRKREYAGLVAPGRTHREAPGTMQYTEIRHISGPLIAGAFLHAKKSRPGKSGWQEEKQYEQLINAANNTLQ
ncbi:TPA: hypothetical protein ACHGFB_005207, partial [Escherichia coli]